MPNEIADSVPRVGRIPGSRLTAVVEIEGRAGHRQLGKNDPAKQRASAHTELLDLERKLPAVLVEDEQVTAIRENLAGEVGVIGEANRDGDVGDWLRYGRRAEQDGAAKGAYWQRVDITGSTVGSSPRRRTRETASERPGKQYDPNPQHRAQS